ncbi:MAG: hypothetical protein M0Q12_00790 [Synergistaceae bacterium]|jgi:hypothetical protein|nr:hypothetical protein [Synergistaceae bacterium]
MKLSEAVKQYEECMRNRTDTVDCGTCPLFGMMRLDIGDPHDETGGITWTIQGCSIMGIFEKWLKNKKPGTALKE